MSDVKHTPAFPVHPEVRDDEPHAGMSLRDWFAGQVLAGLCANPGGPFQANTMSGWGLTNCDENTVAEVALRVADAMLAKRAKASGETP